MADRYWVGGTGNWSDATNHWSTSSGGSPGASKPTSADNVYVDDNSFSATGQRITVNETANCLDFIWSYSIATWDANLRGSSALNIYGSWEIPSYMSLTSIYTGTLTFKATSTGKTITTNGIALECPITFDGVGGGWTLQDPLIMSTSDNFTLTAGTFNSGNWDIYCSSFSISGSSTRTMTLGSSTVYCNSWTAATTTNLTWTANTATIQIDDGGQFASGGLTYDTVNLLSGATRSVCNIAGACTVTNILFSANVVYTFTNSTTYTFTNIYGDGSVVNPVHIKSNSATLNFTISTPSTVVRDYWRVYRCTKAGAGSITITHGHDELGNSGITFSNAFSWLNKYWVGGTGDWSVEANWATSSGGTGGSASPSSTYSENAIFDANSFSGAGQTITLNISISVVDFIIDSPLYNPTFTGSTNKTILSNLTFAGTFTWSTTGSVTFTSTSLGKTITSAGKHLAGNSDITFNGTGGGWTLQDDLNNNSGAGDGFVLTAGALYLNGYTLNVLRGTVNISGSTTRTLDMTDSTVDCNTWTATTVTNLTLTTTGSTINMTNAGTATFAGGGKTYNDVIFNVLTLTVSGANTFANIGLTGGKTHKFPTTNITTLTGTRGLYGVNVSVASKAILTSVTAANDSPFTKTSGTVNVYAFDIKDTTMSGGATFNAYESTNNGNNTGWTFGRGTAEFPTNIEMLLSPSYEISQADVVPFASQELLDVDAGMNNLITLDFNPVTVYSHASNIPSMVITFYQSCKGRLVFDNNGIMYISFTTGTGAGNSVIYKSSDTTYTSFSAIASLPITTAEYGFFMAFDSANDLHVVYTDLSPTVLHYSKYSGGSWSTPISYGSSTFACAIVIDTDDRIFITYYTAGTGVRTREIVGGAFGTIRTVGASAALGGAMVINPANGDLLYIVAETGVTDRLVRLYTSADHLDTTPSLTSVIFPESLSTTLRPVCLTFDADNGLHALAFDNGSPYDIHYAYSSDYGVTWKDIELFTNSTSVIEKISIIALSRRNVTIMYSDSAYNVFYVRRGNYGWNGEIDTTINADNGITLATEAINNALWYGYVDNLGATNYVKIDRLASLVTLTPPTMNAITAKLPTPTLSIVTPPQISYDMKAITAKVPTPVLSIVASGESATAPAMVAITAKIPTPLLRHYPYPYWLQVAPTPTASPKYTYSICEFNGKIYAGTDNSPTDGCELYEWNGYSRLDLVASRYDAETSIFALIEFNNKLYAGTASGGKLLEWNGSDAWVQKASILNSQTHIECMAIFNGELYAGTYPNARLFKWNGVDAWTQILPQPGGSTFIIALVSYDGYLYGVDYDGGRLLRWDGIGAAWTSVAPNIGDDLITVTELNGEIYGGAGDTGRLLRWNGVNAWEVVAAKLNSQTAIMSIIAFEGFIYGTTYPHGRLFRWNGINAWTQVADQLNSKTYTTLLAIMDRRLYAGTGQPGALFEYAPFEKIYIPPEMKAITAKVPTPVLGFSAITYVPPIMVADTAKVPTPVLSFEDIVLRTPPEMKAITAKVPTPVLTSIPADITITPYTMRCLRARLLAPLPPGFIQAYTYTIEVLEFLVADVAEATTDGNTLVIAGHTLVAQDMIVNVDRRSTDTNRGSRSVASVGAGTMELNGADITGQTVGDDIRLYKYVDRTDLIRVGTFRLMRKGAGQSQLDFQLVTTSNYLVKKGQYVRVVADYLGSESYVFWGYVSDNSEELVGAGQSVVLQTVSCQSLNAVAARRSIEIDEAADVTYGSIVQKMVDDYLFAEGVTAGTIDAGAILLEDWTSEVISIGEVLDECASKSGYQWFIDDNLALQFYQEPVVVPDASHEIRQDLSQINVWRNYFNLKFSGNATEYFNKVYFAGGKDENGNDIVLYREDLTEMNAQQDLAGGTGVFGNIQRDTSLVETDYKTCEAASTTSTINITAHGQAVGDIVWNYTRDEYREVLTKPSNDQFTVTAFSSLTAESSAAAEVGTNTTNIKITGHGLVTADAERGTIIHNSTRGEYRWVLAVVDVDNFTVLAVTAQTNGDTIKYSGDIIAFFDKVNDQLQALAKKQSVEPTTVTFKTPESFDPLTKLLVDVPELGRVDEYYLIEDVEIIDIGAGLSKCWYTVKGTRRNNSSFSSQRKLSYKDYWRDF